MLINQGQRSSSSLGFQTLHAKKQRNTFMSKYCRYVSAKFCRYNTSATLSYRPKKSVCRYIGRALDNKNIWKAMLDMHWNKSKWQAFECSCRFISLKKRRWHQGCRSWRMPTINYGWQHLSEQLYPVSTPERLKNISNQNADLYKKCDHFLCMSVASWNIGLKWLWTFMWL